MGLLQPAYWCSALSDFDGHVLRGPRVAPANDPKTGAPTGGVDRDIKDLSLEGDASHAPDHGFTEGFTTSWGDYPTHACVDQYRSSSLVGLGSPSKI